VANLDYAEVKNLAQAVPERVLGYTTQESERDVAAVFGKMISSSENTTIEIQTPDGRWQVDWSSPGQHNLSNALAVVALCLHLGLTREQIQKGLTSFSGVARRQDVLGEIGGIKVIDDFAHHPTAVRATLQAIRRQYPERRIWALFEPRSNTSKRDLFQKDYAQAFSGADEIIISDVFMPEKVKDGKVLDTERLVHEIQENTGSPARHLSGTEEILAVVTEEARSGDLILLMSNGDFGGLGPKLLNGLAPKVKAT
jgi:UDP-N-acetylmuramate: L-alanyl-gamma-D-glutamyl-meso-diaminopimelate ligase